jgi:hypothetical protein
MAGHGDWFQKQLAFADTHAHEARITWETTPTMVNTFTTAQALGLGQGVEHNLKALMYYEGRPPGRHGLVGMWGSLPLARDVRERFYPLVREAEVFRRGVPYPNKRAYRVHTEETSVEYWQRFLREGAAMTDFVESVGDHVRNGAPAPPGWRPQAGRDGPEQK